MSRGWESKDFSTGEEKAQGDQCISDGSKEVE